MSNSIDIKLGDNNSMKSLMFLWKALFKDGSFIEQFDGTGEHKFQEVRNKFNQLQYFYLYNKLNPKQKFIVDLMNGIIWIDKIENYPENIEKKENIRLIYFRRNKVELTEKLEEIKHTIIYHLGFQWLDSHNINQKIIMEINESGNFIIHD